MIMVNIRGPSKDDQNSKSFGVLSYFPFILDQCCALNDVPDECLGLCMEDVDTSIAERSAFTSVCDKYQSTVVKCTVEGGGIRFN